ncbi:maleylpyruvate isomerase N-terminal domain-containing protein [Dyadobacter sp. CY343]|uniref:maleylpyruvate isomerase N-terminal domain-containing protein n=1 Tax=Dyadobacter sp. CY343 TaxID=2907299 RepID=UPI001F2C803A|nr:maleylpyruvate isomerase N-terminal domain-containing protein [Dyadobacter sp. CY343]MCE7060118.1 maleylpyruvate isomerase N-terminal domain-containing protein [Dyadobacter sp. CY343]
MKAIIETRHLFPALDEKLIELLRSLSTADWQKPTVARLWTVKDVASHLLDGNLRMISLLRDGHSAPPDREINSYADLIAYLNLLNADWVKATKRLSPEVMIDLLESTGRQYSALIAAEELHSDAIFPVAWAGEAVSKNWFHIAREYTEKWHHQQQIREATDRQGIITDALFYPFMATSLRGLPHTYRNTDAPTGTVISITIRIEREFKWFLTKNENSWEITTSHSGIQDAGVLIPAEIAWKLFTKAISPTEARENIDLTGDEKLAEVTLQLIAVMA